MATCTHTNIGDGDGTTVDSGGGGRYPQVGMPNSFVEGQFSSSSTTNSQVNLISAGGMWKRAMFTVLVSGQPCWCRSQHPNSAQDTFKVGATTGGRGRKLLEGSDIDMGRWCIRRGTQA